MAKIKVVAPSDLGKGLAVESDKVVVKIVADKGLQVTDTGLQVTDDLLGKIQQATDNAIASGTLETTTLKLAKTGGGTVDVDLSALAPKVVADTFLKSVTYDEGTKSFKFTVGQQNGGSDTELTVPAKDFLKLNIGDGLTGNGTSTPLALDVTRAKALLKETRDVELTDLAGNTLAFAYSAE